MLTVTKASPPDLCFPPSVSFLPCSASQLAVFSASPSATESSIDSAFRISSGSSFVAVTPDSLLGTSISRTSPGFSLKPSTSGWIGASGFKVRLWLDGRWPECHVLYLIKVLLPCFSVASLFVRQQARLLCSRKPLYPHHASLFVRNSRIQDGRRTCKDLHGWRNQVRCRYSTL